VTACSLEKVNFKVYTVVSNESQVILIKFVKFAGYVDWILISKLPLNLANISATIPEISNYS